MIKFLSYEGRDPLIPQPKLQALAGATRSVQRGSEEVMTLASQTHRSHPHEVMTPRILNPSLTSTRSDDSSLPKPIAHTHT